MSALISKLNDGGPLFTYPMMVILIIIIALFILELVRKGNLEKTISLLKSIGWFVIVWGFMGHSLGLIGAFDQIQAAGDVSPEIMAGGLKIALLCPLIGSIVFLIARIEIIVLILMEKKK